MEFDVFDFVFFMFLFVVNNSVLDNYVRYIVYMNINDMYLKRDNFYENRSCGEFLYFE